MRPDERVFVSLFVFEEQDEEARRHIDYMLQASYQDTIPLFLWDEHQLVCLVKADGVQSRHYFLKKLTGQLQERFVIKQKESQLRFVRSGLSSHLRKLSGSKTNLIVKKEVSGRARYSSYLLRFRCV